MAYFQELPNISYPSFLNSRNKIEDRIIVKNIFKRAKLRTDLDQAITAFNYYNISEGMRPDMVAQDLYGDSELDWIILISNNIINVRDQWPLNHNDLHEHMLEKYGSEANIAKVEIYETREILDEFNRVIMPAGLRVDKEFSFEYLNFSKQVVKVLSSEVVAGISNYEYEVRLNDEKRRIKVLKPEYVDGFLIDHKEIMTYEESSDYISDRLKGTENPRISGV
tara:strand:+ start:2326 stop:2994 length:669 start_codon:yes stop_codon:yes gene_type:complete